MWNIRLQPVSTFWCRGGDAWVSCDICCCIAPPPIRQGTGVPHIGEGGGALFGVPGFVWQHVTHQAMRLHDI